MAVTEHITSEREQRLNAVLADYLDAVETAGADDRADLLARHPDLASDIVEFFAGQDGIAELATPVRAVVQSRPAEPMPGELGDFRIIREVGRGGMGVVYEAEQISLDRRVALKVLPFAATMDPKQLQRFRNEAKAAASLHHEHIVPVFGVGCERGVHYYAMQFIDGITLAQVIAGRGLEKKPNPPAPFPKREGGEETGPEISPPFPLREGGPGGLGSSPTAPVAALSTALSGSKGRSFYRTAAETIAQASEALEYAHSMGIVHRDVKPGNLMVDAAGKLWVADFGLARFGTDAGLTMSGDLLGTLRYMAPEQAMARHGLADHRVDIYGLGCTLYELLTGKPALVGEDKADILRHIAFEEPIAPRKLDRVIPAELETIALKCLAKELKERYDTAGELAADVRCWLEDKPIKAKPPTLRQRLNRQVRRHPKAIAILMVSLLLATAGLSAGFVMQVNARINRAEVALQNHAYAVKAALTDLMSTILDLAIGQFGFITTSNGLYLSPYEAAVAALDPQLDRIRVLIQDSPEQCAQLDDISSLIHQLLAEYKLIIDAHRRDPMAARERILSHRGKQLMDGIRSKMQEMQHRENALLAGRRRFVFAPESVPFATFETADTKGAV